jgi:type I restriction enzyme M protein
MVRSVSLSEIENNDFNLNIPRYIIKHSDEEAIDLDETLNQINQLLNDIQKHKIKINAYLSELGLKTKLE